MNNVPLDNIKITPLLDTLRLEKISDAEYFSIRYKNYISNSRLSLINPKSEGSPEKFFEGFKSGFNPSFILGSTVHELVLQPDLFELADDVQRPTAKLGAVADELYYISKERKPSKEEVNKAALKVDYYKGNLDEKKLANLYEKCIPYWDSRRQFESTYVGDKELIYLDSKSRETVCKCVTALKNNKNVQEILHPKSLIEPVISECEQAILLDIMVEIPDKNEKFTLKLKSKLDNYTIDKDMNVICVNDVKTLGKILSEFNNNVDKFSYNRELAMYSWLLSLCAKKFYNMDKPTIKGNYLVVSTVPDYYTKVVPMTKKMYKQGWNEFVYLLKFIASEVSSNYRDFAEWI